MTQQRRAFSSAACKVFLGADSGTGGLGPELGWATGVRIAEAMNLFPIDIMGDVRTQRFEPTALKFSGSFDAIHILSAPLSAMRSDGRPLFFQGTTTDIILFEPTSLVLVDIVSGDSVIFVTGWTPESRVWTISYGTVLTHQCGFVATDVSEKSVVRRTV